ncbi:DUF58 domain-containing protein [Mucisphaera calidilacus]|uniref:DUF58 domain-containing protein n=1 Tax=Mucisphaera calidilacus TaxID=2527982 RepID=A0A518BZK0_9BACT|nr:DUF58 domain-containing protein [Mucisphaera calidilacus]QDU72389.1 hypothetical protein Pan265_22540 [Mucisphaera calidilacus]
MAVKSELLPSALLARLERLDVMSRKILRGGMPGERRSKRRGQSVEFADYRPYVVGDDLRFIDWNLYARLDRLFLRVFMEEEDLAVTVALDCSASMAFGDPSKLGYGARVAAALGYISLAHQNRLSLLTFGGPGGIERLPSLRGRRQLTRMVDFLEPLLAVVPDPNRDPVAGDLGESLRLLASTHATPGILVVISDFLQKDDVGAALRYVNHPRWDALAVHVLSPEELDPSANGITGDLRLRDAEDGSTAEVSVTPGLLRRYRDRLEAFRASVRSACHARDLAYVFAGSGDPIDRTILEPLRRRRMLG